MTELMTKRQLAEKWGVTEATVAFWLSAGRLKRTKVGRLTRIKPEDAEEFMRRCNEAKVSSEQAVA